MARRRRSDHKSSVRFDWYVSNRVREYFNSRLAQQYEQLLCNVPWTDEDARQELTLSQESAYGLSANLPADTEKTNGPSPEI